MGFFGEALAQQPTPVISKTAVAPCPHGGINAIVSLAEMQPNEAIFIYNMMCTQAGLQVRPGYKQWATNTTGTGGIRTIIPVRGNNTAGSNDHLFACTSDGIWDITSTTNAPTKVVAWGTTGGNAGWCSWDHCTNAGGDVMLLLCDEVNGYYTFDTNTSTWLKVTLGGGGTQISGVDPATFTFVRLFNNFVFFVQGGTGNAWILPVGQVYGTATVFSFGNKFNHGGNLNSLWGFTYGSYFGTYLYLVGIGDAGDVIAYTGTNPFVAANWSMAGQWYVGDIPPGRRTATNYGGDLVILSSYGAINLSSLFYQKDLADPNAYMTKKIAPAIKSEIAIAQQRGWEIVSYPGQNAMLILDPNPQFANNTNQFCYNLLTNGWSVFRGVPMQCAANWHNQLYTGGADGIVYQMFAGQDNVLFGASTGNSINWGCLGAFNNLQSPGTEKFVDLIRPYYITDQQVPYNVFARYDFNITDLTLGQGLGTVPLPIPAWDTAIWDTALWGVSSVQPQVVVQGVSGSGHYVAVGLLGSSNGNTTLITFDVSYRPTKGFL